MILGVLSVNFFVNNVLRYIMLIMPSVTALRSLDNQQLPLQQQKIQLLLTISIYRPAASTYTAELVNWVISHCKYRCYLWTCLIMLKWLLSGMLFCFFVCFFLYKVVSHVSPDEFHHTCVAVCIPGVDLASRGSGRLFCSSRPPGSLLAAGSLQAGSPSTCLPWLTGA